MLQADKHSLVETLNIPYRDLRILDPLVRRSAVCCQPAAAH